MLSRAVQLEKPFEKKLRKKFLTGLPGHAENRDGIETLIYYYSCYLIWYSYNTRNGTYTGSFCIGAFC